MLYYYNLFVKINLFTTKETISTKYIKIMQILFIFLNLNFCAFTKVKFSICKCIWNKNKGIEIKIPFEYPTKS